MGIAGRSSVEVRTGPSVGRTSGGVPLVGYPRTPGRPPVTVAYWTGHDVPAAITTLGTHAHDFLMLLYVEHGEGPIRVDGRDWHLRPGDAFVVAPGAAVASPAPSLDPDAAAWVVYCPADAVDPAGAAPLVSWRAHPLLAPFSGAERHGGGGARRLAVPPADRPAWSTQLAALAEELERRRDGHAEAVRAHLTLLLVWLGRLDVDVPTALADDPLLASVFDVVERRYTDAISLREVAAAVGLTTGHLTTVVRRRTGRTVQQWITERRMREARRLLADTDLPVAWIAGRVGYRDPGYFVRRFRTEHGVPPQAWRRAG